MKPQIFISVWGKIVYRLRKQITYQVQSQVNSQVGNKIYYKVSALTMADRVNTPIRLKSAAKTIENENTKF